MGKRLFFSKLVTKSLTAHNSDRRLFEGILTVEMKDRQNEITVRDELLKVLPIWMARGAPITDTHSNRVIGRGINFAATVIKDSEGTEYPAITIQGEIFKDYELDNDIWKSIVEGRYKGLSFGGATKSDRRPIQQSDGSIAYSLHDLEHYEVAVCEEPAVPLALITQFNPIAKAIAGKTEDRGNGQMCIKCDKFKCYIDKGVSDVIEREHELLGEKPDKKEQDVHDKLRDEFKNGEPFSDVQGENAPNKDDKADALKNSYGDNQDNKQDSPKAEELEAQQSQGPNQDNGSTYRGTSKTARRSTIDTSDASRNEQVFVKDLPSTDLTHDYRTAGERVQGKEKEGPSQAHDEPEGPVTKEDEKKVVGAAVGTLGRLAGGLGGSLGSTGGMSGAAGMFGAGAGGFGGGTCDDSCKSKGGWEDSTDQTPKEGDDKPEAFCQEKAMSQILENYKKAFITNRKEAYSFDEVQKILDEALKDGSDTQLQGNNSEDGINGKMRTDEDESAEAFDASNSSANSPATKGDNMGVTGGGVRHGAAYNSQEQGTGQLDEPRKVIVEERGNKDSDNGGDNPKFNKAIIDLQTVNILLKTKLLDI